MLPIISGTTTTTKQNPMLFISLPLWSSPFLSHKSLMYQVSICTESLDMCFIVPEESAFAYMYPPPRPACYHVGSQVLSLSLPYTCALFLHWSFCLPLSNSLLYSFFVCLTFLSSKNIFFYFMFTWDAPRLHSLDSSWTWQSLILSNTRGYAIVLCIQEPYLPWNFFWKPKQNWLVTFLSVSPVGLDVLTLLLLHVIHWLLPHYNPLIAETVVFSTLYSLSLVVCSF